MTASAATTTTPPAVEVSVTCDGRLHISVAGHTGTWSVAPDPKPTPTPTPPAPTPDPKPTTSKNNVPPEVVPDLARLGFDAGHADTILSLISLPENSTIEWWKQYNYIEALGDGRGYTASLFGACSGTGDMIMILNEVKKLAPKHPLVKYIPAMKKTRDDDLKGLAGLDKVVKGLGDDAAWRQAVWTVYVKLYWTFAAAFADKTGEGASRPGPKMTTPLTRGFMVDVALNSGSNLESFKPIIKRMKKPDETDEIKWFLDFAEARRKLLKSGYEDLDTSKTGDRCTLWMNILKEGNVDLKRPIAVAKGYWGSNVMIN
jgi:hypothetical protein